LDRGYRLELYGNYECTTTLISGVPSSNFARYCGNGTGPMKKKLEYMCCNSKIPLLIASALLSGCALNNFGLLAARATRADGAIVVDVYGVGGYLRTTSDDPGITVGWTRRSYVFRENLDQLPNPGWRYFFVSKPADGAIAQDTRTVGLDLSLAAPEWKATFGYKASTIFISRADSEPDRFIQLFYRPSHPAETQLKYCEGQSQC
jgi:hypothetical protein